eukprot:6768327-Pyramimonas_sp.AAC.1
MARISLPVQRPRRTRACSPAHSRHALAEDSLTTFLSPSRCTPTMSKEVLTCSISCTWKPACRMPSRA